VPPSSPPQDHQRRRQDCCHYIPEGLKLKFVVSSVLLCLDLILCPSVRLSCCGTSRYELTWTSSGRYKVCLAAYVIIATKILRFVASRGDAKHLGGRALAERWRTRVQYTTFHIVDLDLEKK
jgi:hypothetical protein